MYATLRICIIYQLNGIDVDVLVRCVSTGKYFHTQDTLLIVMNYVFVNGETDRYVKRVLNFIKYSWYNMSVVLRCHCTSRVMDLFCCAPSYIKVLFETQNKPGIGPDLSTFVQVIFNCD